ncbi:MAG: PIN domain-containing protein [Sulfurisoma sp.]|nr:PIN domain-containing protein [Sulfurisoma sp.]
MRNILLDSGPLIALFASTDRHHARYREIVLAADRDGLRFVTTWPCIVEASYLLSPEPRFAMLNFIRQGGAQIYPFDVSHLDDILVWMRRYTEAGKREMDLADASLYWLASETGITEIMTVDRNDFERYRLPDGRGFEIV